VSDIQIVLMGMILGGRAGEDRRREMRRWMLLRSNFGGERRKRYKREGGSKGDEGAKREKNIVV
jgi:hypothetical protein